MPHDKPQTAAGYDPEWVKLARGTCLHVASVLGDLIQEQLVVVGGLVPGLLVAEDPDGGIPAHAGTMDLDLGLKLAVFDGAQYAEIAKRLREGGYKPDTNDKGNQTFQRWSIEAKDGAVALLDFLIAPTEEKEEPRSIKKLEADFGAIVTPGLELAFRDRQLVEVDGCTLLGEKLSRTIAVCGPGAFVVLKALAIGIRATNKDAYDLFYVLRNYGSGVDAVVERLKPLLDAPEANRALDILTSEFESAEHIGPSRVAAFLGNPDDAQLKEEVVAFVQDLLKKCGRL